MPHSPPGSLRALLATAALAALLREPARAAETSLEPTFSRGYGSTLFRMQATVDRNGSQELFIRSELEFPLDVFLAGLKARQEYGSRDRFLAGISFSAFRNFSDPDDPMLDSDWLGTRTSGGTDNLFKFSYTESESKLLWYGGEAGFDVGWRGLWRNRLRFGLSVRFDRFELEMFGAEGWQQEPGNARQAISAYRDSLVLTYALTRLVPRWQAEMEAARWRGGWWKVKVSLSPVAMAWDRDDHVLRNKRMHTFAQGIEVGGATSLRMPLSRRLYLSAAADLYWFQTRGDMEQYWYADDPFSPDDEAGLRVGGIDNTLMGLSGTFALGIGAGF